MSTLLKTIYDLMNGPAPLRPDDIENKCQGKSWLIRKRDTSWYYEGKTFLVLIPPHLKNWHDVHKAPLSVLQDTVIILQHFS